MHFSEKQLYEKVAGGELAMTEAMDLLKQMVREGNMSVPGGTAGMIGQSSLTWTFTYDEPLLKDHTVFGDQVLLGVTHCSLAVEAWLKAYPGRALPHIHKLFFSSPIILQPSEKVEIDVFIEERDGQAKFKNRYSKSPSGEKGETASGEYRLAGPQPSSIDIEAFKSQCEKAIEIDQIYREDESQPIKIGPSLRNIQRVYVRGRDVLGELTLFEGGTGSFAVLPSLLNGAVMCCMYGLPEDFTETYLPFMVKKAHIYRQIKEKCLSFSSIVSIGPEILEADISLCDTDGSVLAELKGFTCKRVRSAESFSVQGEPGAGSSRSAHLPGSNSSPPASAAKVPGYGDSDSVEVKIERFIVDNIESLLGKSSGQPVNVNKNFMDLGLDSASLVAFTQKIEKNLGIDLYPTLFFEYQNVKELAAYFAAEHRDAFSAFIVRGDFNRSSSPVEDKKSVIAAGAGGVSDIGSTGDIYDFSSRFIIPGGISGEGHDDCEGIAVIGMAGVFPDAPNVNAFWKALREKRDLIKEIPPDHFDYRPWFVPGQQVNDRMYCKWGSFINDVDKFDAGFFNISPREANVMDPQMRHLLQVLHATAEDAGCAKTIRGTRTGMYTGVCFYDYKQEMDRLGKIMAPHDGTGNSPTMMSNRPSFFFDLKGPSLTVDTACSSSLIALHIACKALKNNECDMALVAGANLLLSSLHYRYFCSIGALSYTGRCHTFDERADGYVPGEAVAAVLLKPLKKAVEDRNNIHAVIKGSAINHGGYTQSVTAPSVKMEARCVMDAWKDAGVDPETIGYIEAHGTGTKLGDPVEINGLISAFREYTGKKSFCAVGSAKAHIGHTEGAAGIAGLIKTILSIKNKEIPAMPMFKKVNPYIKLEGSPLYINPDVEKWERISGTPRRAGVSSFGFGGANAHVVVEEYESLEDGAAAESRGPQVVPLSARNEERLKDYASKLAGFLEEGNDRATLSGIAYTLQAGREEMEERVALVVSTREDLYEKLSRYSRGDEDIDGLYQGNVKTAFPGKAGESPEYQGDGFEDREPDNAARMWVLGGQPDWSKLHRGFLPGHVSLPTYPFEKKRYWIPVQEIGKGAQDHLVSVSLRDDSSRGAGLVYMESKWVKSPITGGGDMPDSLLVFGNDDGVYQRLKNTLKERGSSPHIILVKPGSFYRDLGRGIFELNPGEPDDYVRLIEELKGRNFIPGGVLYLWQAGNVEDSDLSRGVISVFCLIKSLSAHKIKVFPKIVYTYEGGSENPSPLMESVAGFSKSLALLWPGATLTAVEVAAQAEDIALIALEEMAAHEESFTVEIKYEGGERYVREFQPIETDNYQATPLKKGGTYLITGGAGALGMNFARRLAGLWGANLVLTGRSVINERIDEKIHELKALGADAMYVRADAASPADMKEAVKKARKRFGPINGVIHAAGTIDAIPVSQKDITAFRSALSSKIDGTIVLDEVTGEEPLDFFVMFSSISSVLGDFGQCDYAVGNRFMDGFARYREILRKKNMRSGRTVSINWPLWREGGMQGGREEEQLYLQLSGLWRLETQDGLQAFERILSWGTPQVVVLSGDRDRILGMLATKLRSGLSPAAPKAGQETVIAGENQRPAAESPVSELLLGDIKRVASQILQLSPDDLDSDQSFGIFGFESITLKEFAVRISEAYNIEIAPTVFFSRSSLEKLAGYLLEEFGEEIHCYYTRLDEKVNNKAAGEKRREEFSNSRQDLKEENSPEKRVPRKEEYSGDVAVIGISGIFPGARNHEEFWDNLLAGKDLITEIPESRWDWNKYYGDPYEDDNRCYSKWGGFIDHVDKFDAPFFNISPREAELMDPQHRLFLETAWRAIEDGGYRPTDLSGNAVGVFVGVQGSDYLQLLTDAGETGAEIGTGNSHAMLANRVSYHLNLRGPSESVDTACSSSLVAIQRAVRSIGSGECQLALAGGVSLILSPRNFLAAGRLGMLSPDGRCKTFDRSANGFVKGEGVGVLLLKSAGRAIEDGDHIYAVIKATAVNHGGKASSLTAPNPDAQADLIAGAYNRAGIDPETVSYIETHGTGTELGDPVEVQGLLKAFKEIAASLNRPIMKNNYCGLGSVKTNIGHLEPAAGIAGVFKVILAMRHRMLPGNLHLSEINPLIDFKDTPFYIVDSTRAWERLEDSMGNAVPRRAGVSSFGYGGTNAHVVLEEYRPSPSRQENESLGPELIVLSARNEERLRDYASQLAGFLSKKALRLQVDAVRKELAAAVSQILNVKVEDLSLEVDLREYGLDHVQISDLLKEINDRYGYEINPLIFSIHPTINSLAGNICENKDNTVEKASISNIAYTLQTGRDSMEERLAVVVNSVQELIEKLTRYFRGEAGIDGLYSGNAGAARKKPGISGASRSDPVSAGKADPDKLARLWVAGEEVDWSILRRGRRYNRVSLPTYPFARYRYWVPQTDSIKGGSAGNTAGMLHPLIDSNVSTLENQCFKKLFRPDEFFLRDHVVAGRRVLPAAAYLEMARKAGELSRSGSRVKKIKNIVWESPIPVNESPEEIFINLSPAGGPVVEFEVIAGGAPHARGELVYGENGQDSGGIEYIDIQAVIKRCRENTTGPECYRVFEKAGLNYGSSFQAVRGIYSSGDEALSMLKLPGHLKGGFADYILHPALVDGAMQTVMGLKTGEKDKGKIHLPFALGEVELAGMLTEECHAYATLSGKPATGNSGVIKYNILIIDDQGRVVARLKDFSLRAAAGSNDTEKSESRLAYCRREWEESPVIKVNDQMINNVLLFDNGEGIREALRALFKKEGRQSPELAVVKPGDSFRDLGNNVFQINPGKPGDYRMLLEALNGYNLMPSHIIHAWSREPLDETGETLGGQLDRGVYSLLSLCQGLMEQRLKNIVQLLYIYTGHGGPQPQYSGVAGFLRTIRREYPGIVFRTIELEGLYRRSSSLEESLLAEAALAEMAGDPGEVEIRYRDGVRLVRRIKEIDFSGSGGSGLLRSRGVYIITGGTGGLGLVLAEFLAGRYGARLVLAGRSELSGLSEAKRAGIKQLKKLGAEVLYVKADVSRREDVERLVSEVRSRFGEINGIIHCAGVIRDSLALKKTREEMDEVLAPKVYGTLFLDEGTKGEKLDFFILFSSIAAVMGNVGQSDYAYANCFMDAFAERRRSLEKAGKRSGITLSFNWPLWEEGGMKLDDGIMEWMEENLGIVPMSTENGLKAFEDGLEMDLPVLTVFEGKEKNIENMLSEYNSAELLSAAGTGEAVNITVQKDLDLREKAVRLLKEIVSRESKQPVARIHEKEQLEKYGINSVMIMRLTRELEKSFGPLSKTLFFEYQNISDLSDYFTENHRERIIEITAGHEEVGMNKSERPVPEVVRPRFSNPGIVRESDRKEEKGEYDIAVIGVSGRYPMAGNLEEFWENLKNGRDCITEIPQERWDYRKYYDPEKGKRGKIYGKWGGFIDGVDKFDPLFFNMSPRDAEVTDPQERLFLETVWQTLEDAGYTGKGLEDNRVGVFVGVMYGEYQLLGAGRGENSLMPVSSYASIANRVSYYFNFSGPSIALDTMCSSSLTAIHLACESISRGESDIAIAGGVNLSIHPHKYFVLSQSKFVSSDGRCRSFGEGGDGYVPGEGVGAVILKPLKKAVADGDNIYGLIKGSSINHGGRTNGYSVPNPKAQASLIYETLTKAGINPRTISYIEAHGTGTSLGDPIEINGLINAFDTRDRQQYCSIGSVKSNIGHLESAAGIAGITKILLQMKHRQLVPSIHSEKLNPNINFKDSPFYVQRTPAEWNKPVIVENGVEKRYPRRAGISSFGAGGANAHIILEEYEKQAPVQETIRGPYLFVLSSRNGETLKKYAGEMAGFVKRAAGPAGEGLSIEDAVYTSQAGREAMEERLALIVFGTEDLCDKLDRYSQGEEDIDGLYRGNALSAFNTGLMPEGRAGDEYIKAVLGEGELDKIARLWVSGADLDWDLLYKDGKPGRISLPGYPFDRKRYWVDSFRPGKTSAATESKAIASPSPRPGKADPSAPLSVPYRGSEVSLRIIDDNIALVAMQDRENRNMFSGGIVNGLIARLSEISQNENIKAVILTGYENIFSMGGTREELLNIADKKNHFTDASVFYNGLLECQVPVISAIQGHANGGGLALGLFADIVVMSEESIYSASFMKYGFTPGLGATYILREKLGANLAAEMMFTAKSYRGDELKNRAAPVLFRKQKDVLSEAFSIAKMLCEKPLYALKVLKRDLSGRVLEELPAIIQREMDMHDQTFSHPEVRKRINYYFDRPQSLKAKQSAAAHREDVRVLPAAVEKNFNADEEKVRQKIAGILVDILHMEENQLNRERSFNELGVDSISAVEIIREINKCFSLELEAVTIYDYETIDRLAGYVCREIGSKRSKSRDLNQLVALPVEKSITTKDAYAGNKIQLGGKAADRPGRKGPAGSGKGQDGRIKLAAKGQVEQAADSMPAGGGLSEKRARAKVAEIAAEILHIQDGNIDFNRNFKDLGVDSVTIVEIIRDVNKFFGLNLEAARAYDYPTVESLTGFIMQEIERNAESRAFISGSPGSAINGYTGVPVDSVVDSVNEEIDTEDEKGKQFLDLLRQLRNGDLDIDEVNRLTEASYGLY
ncbi:MAG: hypothetical protein JL50_19400 [Peptococcaceae bacterium BICA1-7]|nr:MAG: hypothetical protein JL50_19400 [Peptococcaceae bacterium BICA1-7]